jgi:hypothetical protein
VPLPVTGEPDTAERLLGIKAQTPQGEIEQLARVFLPARAQVCILNSFRVQDPPRREGEIRLLAKAVPMLFDFRCVSGEHGVFADALTHRGHRAWRVDRHG